MAITKSVEISGVTALAVDGEDRLLDALVADVVGLLDDERLYVTGLELVDLRRPGVEADDLDVPAFACWTDRSRCPVPRTGWRRRRR